MFRSSLLFAKFLLTAFVFASAAPSSAATVGHCPNGAWTKLHCHFPSIGCHIRILHCSTATPTPEPTFGAGLVPQLMPTSLMGGKCDSSMKVYCDRRKMFDGEFEVSRTDAATRFTAIPSESAIAVQVNDAASHGHHHVALLLRGDALTTGSCRIKQHDDGNHPDGDPGTGDGSGDGAGNGTGGNAPENGTGNGTGDGAGGNNGGSGNDDAGKVELEMVVTETRELVTHLSQ